MMREPVDLRRAVKEEVGRDLSELTFTPEMRERVLARIPRRSRSRLTWLYPASAAAAVLLILVTSTTDLWPKTTQRESAAESAKQATSAAPTEANSTGAGASAKSVSPPETVAPDQPKDGPETRLQALDGPVTNFGSAGDSAMMARALGPQLAALQTQQSVVTLTNGAVTRIDPAGAPVWQVVLPASKQAEQVVSTPEGKLVVAASSTVLLLSPDGSMLESLQLTEPVLHIATGTHDRLALVGERAVYVRQAAGRPPAALAASNAGAAAFASDGLLLLAIPEGLAAYDGDGNRRWLITGEGGPLLVSPDGKTILWGSALYDSTGMKLSELAFAPGVVADGLGLLRWNGEQLQATTWAGEGTWSWTAPGFITAVFTGEGDRTWVALETQEGIKLQGLLRSTGRPVGKAQSLTATPQEMIALDGRLYLRLPEGLSILQP